MDKRTWLFIGVSLAAAVILAALVSPFASSAPDGLDRFAEDHQFAQRAEGQEVWTRAPLADYKVAAVKNEGVSTGLAGVLGTLAVFAVAFALGKWAGRRKSDPVQAANP